MNVVKIYGSAVLRFPSTFTENDITVVAAHELAGLLNLESLNMSKNRLDDESFGPDSLSVSMCASRAASRLLESRFSRGYACGKRGKIQLWERAGWAGSGIRTSEGQQCSQMIREGSQRGQTEFEHVWRRDGEYICIMG